MSININFSPGAGAVAGSALLAGNGQYAQNVNQLLTQQWQTAAQIQNSRMMAMAQAAQEAQQQQSQQQFELQKMPMQAALQSQQMQYQNQLGMQANDRQQMLHDYYGGQRSQQDFSEQQDLSAQNAQQQADNQRAQIQLQQQGDLQKQQQITQYKNDAELMQSFQSGSYQKTLQQIQQQATENGSDYTDEQKSQIKKHQNTLAAAAAAVGSQEGMGNSTAASVRPAVKEAMAAISNIYSNPGQPPPPDIADVVSKKISWGLKDPQSGEIIPGTESTPFTIDKDGNPKVVQGWKAPQDTSTKENDEALVNEKVAALKGKNNTASIEWAVKMADKEMQLPANQMAAINNPSLRDQLIQKYAAMHAELTPGLNTPVRSASTGETAAGIAGSQSPPGAVNPRLPANDSSSGQPGWNAPQPPAAGIQPQAQQQAQPVAAPNPNDVSNFSRDAPWAMAVMKHYEQHPDLSKWSTEDLLALRKARMILGPQQ